MGQGISRWHSSPRKENRIITQNCFKYVKSEPSVNDKDTQTAIKKTRHCVCARRETDCHGIGTAGRNHPQSSFRDVEGRVKTLPYRGAVVGIVHRLAGSTAPTIENNCHCEIRWTEHLAELYHPGILFARDGENNMKKSVIVS